MFGATQLTGFGAKRAVGFTPADLTGLHAWFRGDLGLTLEVGDKVSNWADQSGNGIDLAQATDANRPVLNTAAVGGQDALHFRGVATNDRLFSTAAGWALVQPVHYFLVMQPDSPANADYLFHATTTANHGVNTTSTANQYQMLASGVALITIPNTTDSLLQSFFDGASSYQSVDDGTKATGNPGTVGIGSGWNLCTAWDAGSGWAGYVAEIVVVGQEVTGTEYTGLLSYFSARYGFSF